MTEKKDIRNGQETSLDKALLPLYLDHIPFALNQVLSR